MTDPRLSQIEERAGRCPTCESPDMFWHKEVAGKLCADSWHLTRNDLLSRVKELEAERGAAEELAKAADKVLLLVNAVDESRVAYATSDLSHAVYFWRYTVGRHTKVEGED